MATLDYRKAYRGVVSLLTKTHSYEQAMKVAVGGEFEAVGVLERELLIHLGLRSEDYLIDVGCGSGRLVKPLSPYLSGKYLGIDIVPELVQYASKLVHRPDWRFEVAEGLTIPEVERSSRHDLLLFRLYSLTSRAVLSLSTGSQTSIKTLWEDSFLFS